MALTYNKKIIKKDRSIQSRGPRDHQRAQAAETASASLVEDLKTTINNLQSELTRISVKGVNPEVLDNEIIKAVKEETAVLNNTVLELKAKIKLKEEHIESLEQSKQGFEKEIISLRTLLKDKDDFIAQLKNNSYNNPSAVSGNFLQRPEMEKQFIDPIENGGSSVESHININKETSLGKESLNDKISKLKKLKGLKDNK